jgi:retinol dehydrogenase 12
MPSKTALVTGGTSGIGKAVATGLARSGFAVTLLARDAHRGETARADILKAVPGAGVHLLDGDLSLMSSVRAAAGRFQAENRRLDLLVHSAGVFLPERRVTAEGVEATFATNHLGQFLMTSLLVPLLRESAPARVVVVASRYGKTRLDLDDLNMERRAYSYLKAVPASKLAQVLTMQELAERLQGTGVTVNAVHPGLVAGTRLLEQTGGPLRWLTNRVGGTPEQGADTVLWLATSADASGATGGLWAKRKRMPTPGQGSDPAFRKRLWAKSEEMAGLVAAPPPAATLLA